MKEQHNFLAYKEQQHRKYQKGHTNNIIMYKERMNPVYRFMRTQNILSSLLTSFLQQDKKTDLPPFERLSRTNIQKNQRTKFSMSEGQSKKKVKQETKFVFESFSHSLRKFHEGVDKSKKRLSILTKFDNDRKQFEKKIPQEMGEQTRQSIEENEKLLNVCKQQFLPDKTSLKYYKKAEKLRKYKEPSIQNLVRKELRSLRKGRKRIASQPQHY